MSENKFIRCKDDDDPDRCQGVTGKGQCIYMSQDQSNFCPMHGGNRAGNEADRIELRNLRLSRAKWMTRAKELADSEGITSLRDEIAICRLMLEEKLEGCKGPADLMLASPMISEWVMKIEKLVSSAHRLESSLGQLLDKAAVVQLTGELIAVISDGLDGVMDNLISELGEEHEDTIRNAMTADVVDKICETVTQTTVAAGRKESEDG
jgi:hypothetical protein